ncbi:DUF1080 domain-containing protein [bacterium]|nr:DUF1080 domain-containing protein [bacterium]
MSVSIGNFKNVVRIAAFAVFFGVLGGVLLLSSTLVAQTAISCTPVTLLAGSGSGVTNSLAGKQEDGFVELFNGKDLDGWEQKNGTATYEVVDGTILGQTVKGSPNSFLCSEKEYGNFELVFEVKVDKGLNSGVQIRSVSKPDYKEGRVHGPQVEIEWDPGESGYIYSEGTKRGWVSPTRTQKNVFKNEGWNEYRVLADGPRIQTWINGTCVEDIEMPAIESAKGFLGLQVHGVKKNAGPFKVQWKNIRIREISGDERRQVKAFKGTPKVDGKVDDLWVGVPRVLTSRSIDEVDELSDDQKASTAWVRCLWDEGHLYCLAEVTDDAIGSEAGDEWDRDGVEFFIDRNFARTSTYDDDDAQYRTEPDGNESAGSENDLSTYQSAVTKTKNGYIVEVCIDLKGKVGKKIGFDVQVNNDPGDGRRMSAMKWNDASNDTYFDISNAGTLEMVEGN